MYQYENSPGRFGRHQEICQKQRAPLALEKAEREK